MQSLRRGGCLVFRDACPTPWRLPVGLSLALSLGLLAVVLSAAYLGGDRAAASPLAQPPFDLFINRGEGDCPLCRQADPNYDPEMGYFNLNCSGCPINDTAYVWNRTPFYSDTHSLGSPPYNSFLFWLHRNKGCGDFEMRGTSGNDTVTDIAPFSIPCTGGLGDDTLGTRFLPGLTTLFCSPGQGGCDSPTLFAPNGIQTDLTDEVESRTDTWMNIAGLIMMAAPLRTEFKSLPGGGGELGVQAAGALKVIPPRGVATFTLAVQPDWSQVTQTVGVASQPRVTATLVFTFGPTARISQTLVVAQPYLAFAPLATKVWGAGW